MNIQALADQHNVTLPGNAGLLALYKIEKEQMDMPSNPFPPFKDWKVEYMLEFIDSHKDSRMVDAETAVAETEKEFEAEEKSAAAKTQKKIVKVKKIKQPKAAKPKVEKSGKVSKTELAMTIYKSMMVGSQHPPRKDVIDRFVKEVGLTQSGASTYHHNIKKKLG